MTHAKAHPPFFDRRDELPSFDLTTHVPKPTPYWFWRFAEGHVHSSARLGMLRRQVARQDWETALLAGPAAQRRARIRARRILREVYGEDAYGWDGS